MSDRPKTPGVPHVPDDPAPAEESTMSDHQTQPLATTEDPDDRPAARPGTAAPSGATAPPRPWQGAAPQQVPSPPPVSTEVRVGTIVWGLVLAAVGVGLLALAAGVTFDVELAFIVLVALAGIGLVGGAVVAGVRRGRQTRP